MDSPHADRCGCARRSNGARASRNWRYVTAARTACRRLDGNRLMGNGHRRSRTQSACTSPGSTRSEEHTSELQSLTNLVCRLLLEKKKQKERNTAHQSRTSKQSDI